MRSPLVAALLAGCAAPTSPGDDAGLSGPTDTPTDTSAPSDATCSPAPRFDWLAEDPSEGDRIPFDGEVALEFVSAPVSRFWASTITSEAWSAVLIVEADGFGVPVFDAIRWVRLPGDAFQTGVTWPTDHGIEASDVDLCSATFTLDLTLTELDAEGAPRNDGACTTTSATSFHLVPDAAAAGLCPLFLASEETLERVREQQP